MADRSVKVTVGANVAPLKAAMADGARSVDGLSAKTSSLGAKLKKGLSTVGLTGGILSLGAAIKGTFSLGLDFTTQLNTLQAVSGATAAQMAEVSAKAKALGNDIEIPATSASDAAQAMTELAKGGLSVQQSMDAAKGTLQLAAAAQISGAQAAEIQANALNTFGLKATDAGKVADVLANTANAASGDITDFAQAFQQTGSVAKLFGISIDDTATALGLFANNGVKGSDAGTSLKSMLTQLATPSAKAQAAMKDLNLTVYDGQGKFVGMRSLTDQLSNAQKNMSQQAFQSAAGILFGSDAIRAASILASSGVDAFDDFKASVDRVGGAADLANAQMKGLPGALQNLQNAAENLALGLYENLAPAVESVVNGLSDFINVVGPPLMSLLGGLFGAVGSLASAFGSLPGPIKTFGLALAGVAIASKIGLLEKLSSAFGAVRGAVSGIGSLMSRIGDDAAMAGVSKLRVGMGLAGSAASSLKGKVGELAKSFGPGAALAVGIALVANIISDARNQMHLTDDEIDAHKAAVESLGDAYQQSGGKITEAVRAQAWNDIKKNTPDIVAAAKAAGISMHDLVDAYLNVDSVGGKMARNAIQNWAAVKDAQGGNWFTRTFGVWTSGAKESQEASEKASVAAQGFLAASKEATEAVKDETDAVQGSTGAAKDNAQAKTVASAAQTRYLDQLAAQHSVSGQVSADQAQQKESYYDLADAAQTAYLNEQKRTSWASESVAAGKKTAAAMHSTAAAMQEAADKAHDLTGRASELEAELARLSGRNVSVEEATRAFNGALSRMKEAAKDADGHVQRLGKGIVGANGAINTASKSGQDLYDNVTALGKAAQDQAYAVAELTGKTKGQKAAEDAAAKSLEASRQEFIKSHDAMGLTADQAKVLADRYFGIPKDIKTTIKGDFTDVDTKLANLAQRVADTKIVIPITGEYRGTVGLPTHGSTTIAHATGGWVFGPGTGTSDSIAARLSNGEFVVNAAQARKHGPLLQAINDGAPGFAAGGSVGNYSAPSVASLAGIQPLQLGAVLSTVKAALLDFRGAVAATRDVAKDSAVNARKAASAYRQQLASQKQTSKQQAALVADARTQARQRLADAKARLASTKSDRAASVADAKTRLARVKADEAASVADAKARVSAAKTSSQRASAEKALAKAQQSQSRAVADAQKSLAKAQQAQAKAVKDAEKKVAEARAAGNKSVKDAVAAQHKATKAEQAKTAAAKKAANQAAKDAADAKARQVATQKIMAATKSATQAQTRLAKQIDKTNVSIDATKDKIADLKDTRSQLSSSVADTIVGDSSIMNLDANGVTGLIAGLRGNLSQAKSFQSSLSKLANMGLDNDILQQVAGGGLAASPLAQALAGASASQIKQFNSLQEQIRSVGTGAGNVVANAEYTPLIKQQQAILAAYQSTAADLKKLANQNAAQLEKAVQAGLQGMTVKISMDGKTVDARIEKVLATEARKLAAAR